MTNSVCPCRLLEEKKIPYTKCCAPFHLKEKQASNPEELMRARYSAFSKGDINFLMETLHPSKRSDVEESDLREWAENSTWTGLEIVKATNSTVEFKAHYEMKNEQYIHHELSEFRKEENILYFYDGKLQQGPVVRTSPKVGRNDPCSCGSGKKFKKCCNA